MKHTRLLPLLKQPLANAYKYAAGQTDFDIHLHILYVPPCLVACCLLLSSRCVLNLSNKFR
jgi:hypothetical protein